MLAPEPTPSTRSAAAAELERLIPRLLPASRAEALEVRHAARSAVLIALVERDDELWTVFTRRQEDLRRHAGEISFPGGRHDDDDPTLEATAVREAEEEIGLSPAAVQILGALQPTPTIATGYGIYPFVGRVDAEAPLTANPREVAELITLPLRAVFAGYGRRRLVRRGLPIRTDTYVVDDHLIWGATARILQDLFDRL